MRWTLIDPRRPTATFTDHNAAKVRAKLKKISTSEQDLFAKTEKEPTLRRHHSESALVRLPNGKHTNISLL